MMDTAKLSRVFQLLQSVQDEYSLVRSRHGRAAHYEEWPKSGSTRGWNASKDVDDGVNEPNDLGFVHTVRG